MFEILWELPECDTETRSEQMLLEKMELIDLLEAGLPQTFNLYKVQYLRSTIKQDMPVIKSKKNVSPLCKFKKLIWKIFKKRLAEVDQWSNIWLNNKRAKCRTKREQSLKT